MDPHFFDANPEPDPDPAQNLDADPDSDPDPDRGRGGVGQPKMCIPPGKILGTPLGIATVNLMILTPLLKNHPFIPVRNAKIETHAGTIGQRGGPRSGSGSSRQNQCGSGSTTLLKH